MEFKTYKKKINFKHAIIVAICTAFVLVPITVNTTKAKYQTSESVPLIRGTINYKPYDFKIMAMYQDDGNGDYKEIDAMPSTGYVINEEKSYCYTTTKEEPDNTVVLRTDSDGNHEFGNLKKSSKCYIWFDEKPLPANEYIIANATSTTAMPTITGISSDTSNTLYTVADDDGTSYVFRGNPSNNWVSFGGFYWRIIRINGDGSIRMIYNGTSTAATGTETQITVNGTNQISYSKGAVYNDNAYVGFMYGTAGSNTYAAAHANTNKSNVMSELESWYTNSGLSNYAQYIDQNAGFCNDRKVGTTTMSGYGTLGYGKNNTVYAPFSRFNTQEGNWNTTQQTPSLKCSQSSNDLFTPTGSNKGNKKLSAPVGLITADEVVFAGGFGGKANKNYYLYIGKSDWTMSPYRFNGTGVSMFIVYTVGDLNASGVNNSSGIRPVINLRSDVTLKGLGTTSSPYTVF